MDDRVRAFIEEQIPALATRVIALTRPCVYAMPEEQSDDDIPVGATKFGGNPDVPSDFRWPMTADGPCWFVAQVSLRDLSTFETGFRLPNNGLLSFFYHDVWGPAGTEHKVYLFQEQTLRRSEIVVDPRYNADSHTRHFSPRSLEFRQGYCIPNDIHALRLPSISSTQLTEFENFVEAFHEAFWGGIHQFFGRPRYNTPPNGWQLLASFGEVNDRYLYYIPETGDNAINLRQLKVMYECS